MNFLSIFFWLVVTNIVSPTLALKTCLHCENPQQIDAYESSAASLYPTAITDDISTDNEEILEEKHDNPSIDIPNEYHDVESPTEDDIHDLFPNPRPVATTTTTNTNYDNNQQNFNDMSNSVDQVEEKEQGTEEFYDDRWTGLDTLVAVFFVVAAFWLIAATIYSVILLVLLRLQSRGELDIYDEDLGRVSFCNGRFALHFGCILRRFAIQLEREYQRRIAQRSGLPDEEIEEPTPVRIMTREERRKAMEELLGVKSSVVGKDNEIMNNSDEIKLSTPKKENKVKAKSPASPRSPNASMLSEEGPVCSICLAEYEFSDTIFKSSSCPHMYHKDCLMEWLERRNNTECPCCRICLVSDNEVWATVRKMRKERRRQLRKENALSHRLIVWMLSNGNQRRRQRQASSDVQNSSTSSSSDTDQDPESQHAYIENNASETDLNDTDRNRGEGNASISDDEQDNHDCSKSNDDV